MHTAVIIGAGFSGLCMGIKLKQAGIDDFVILEKAGDLGGTWRENTYPGAECDIPSALYSYSFEHNSEWEYKWSNQAQIHQYQHDVAHKYDLLPHIRYGEEVVKADFDEESGHWRVQTASQRSYIGQHMITAVGQLHIPLIPDFKNQQSFSGEQFHSANWNHQLDLAGKRVGIIGNAASAVQIVPELVEQVAHLTIFQRSANWMMPKLDRPYSETEKKLSSTLPWLAKLYRFGLWVFGEWLILPAVRRNRLAGWLVRSMCRHNLHKSIKDPELRKLLTPDYPVGAKRTLFCDSYYPSLVRDNVTLEFSSISQFNESGIELENGNKLELDVVIYATGFRTNPFLASIDICGRRGRKLQQAWSNGAHAFLGVATSGFPNMHMMYGPNTNLSHSSILIMAEAQAGYITQAISGLLREQRKFMDVLSSVEDEYNQQLQARLAKMAFSQVEHSWYQDRGRITNNWAGSTWEYMRLLKTLDWSGYELV